MWAFMCGVVSSGASVGASWPLLVGGVLLCGPCVCATSQAANDWYDRHVDAINEPDRPIPSGRMPGRWGLYVALGWTALSLLVAWPLGPWAFGAAVFGPRARLGLQRPAVPAEGERLVGQRRRRPLLRGPALVHRRGRDDGGPARRPHDRRPRRSTASARTAS